MAEVTQSELEKKLAEQDVKVAKEDLDEMHENIMHSGGDRWLGVGVHEVKIQEVSLVEAKTGTLGIKFVVANEEGKQETVNWLSEKALPYTIAFLSSIAVHNTAEEKRDALRQGMTKIDSAKQAYEIARAKFVGFSGYLQVTESKTQEYTDKRTGEVKPSLETRLLSYKPNQTGEQKVQQAMGGGEKVEKDEVDLNELPF